MFLTALLTVGLLAPPDAAARMREDVAHLAGPLLRGRGHGSPGLELALAHVQRTYRDLGLRTQVDRFPCPGPPSRVWAELRLDGRTLELGRDVIPLGDTEGHFDEAPVHFAGCGLQGGGRDDLKGVPLAGSVALILREVSGPGAAAIPAADRRLAVRIQALAQAGARAVLVADPGRNTLPLALQEGHGPFPVPVLALSTDLAERLFPRFGDRATALRRHGETGAQSPMGRLTLRLSYARPVVQSPNLTAWIPGKDPRRTQEVIVVGAHLDHLGETGATLSFASGAQRHAPHPGADDNASGTALILELARQLAQSPLDRTVLFVHFSAEELGLLGSRAWLAHPPVPREAIALMVNFDMVGRLPDRRGTLWLGSLNVADHPFRGLLGHLPRDLNLSHDLGALTWASDHATFAIAGIPVLFWFTGLHEDYHRPSDLPERVRVGGLVRILDSALALLRDLGTRPVLQLGEPRGALVLPAGSGQTAGSLATEGRP